MVRRRRASTRAARQRAGVPARCAAAARPAALEATTDLPGPVRACAVSLAGPVDRASGRLVHLPHSPFLVDELDVRPLLEPLVGVPVEVDNDVNWAALAEQGVLGLHVDEDYGGQGAGLLELAQLGRSLWARRAEILAYFDTGASNGPVEAINGRLEHLRGIALGFRNLNHYILRSLIHSGGLAERLHAL